MCDEDVVVDQCQAEATRASWPTEPWPSARARIPIEREYSAAEYARIARGFIPKEIEDHWFIYLEDNWLALHRSWTGYCIFQVRFIATGAGYRIAEAWANRDRAQYRAVDDAADATTMLRLIELLLLGRSFLTPEWPV